MLSNHMWRRSFIAERESRLGDVSGLSKRSAQTKRGHVTRTLLADIADFLGEGQQRQDILKEIRITGGSTQFASRAARIRGDATKGRKS